MTVPATLDTVAVVGNGLIGHGMAQIFAAAGHRVVMIGRRAESLGAAMERITKSLAAFEAHGLVTSAEASAALGRIRTSTDLEDAAEAQLVLEAVPAERAVQDEVYGRLDAICAPPAVFASGSGQPASELCPTSGTAGAWSPPTSGTRRSSSRSSKSARDRRPIRTWRPGSAACCGPRARSR